MLKKTIAKEFLWLVVTIVLAIPLSLLFLASMDLIAQGDNLTINEKKMVVELFIVIYIFSFTGIYLIRFIVGAVKVIAKSDES